MERYVDAPPPTGSGGHFAAKISQRIQILSDKSAPYVAVSVYNSFTLGGVCEAAARWLLWLGFVVAFAARIWLLKGFYIVAYALGIFNLNLLLGFLSPQVDPALEGPSLPSKGNDEFKPFVRRLPEFKFWYSSTKALCLGFCATFFSAFDVPVFWPILLLYWSFLFFLTMKRQIRHMLKYRYLPFSFGKRKYADKGKDTGQLR